MVHDGHTARLVAIRVSTSKHTPLSLAYTCPYSVLSISATMPLSKGQPWRPERSAYVEPPPSTESPSLTDTAPQVFHLAVFPCPSPTGHSYDPRTIPEAHGHFPLRAASPTTFDTTLPEADLLWSPLGANIGRSLRPTLPAVRRRLQCHPTIDQNPPTRIHIDFSLLSRGVIRVRLAWATRLETKRRRITIANKQSMLMDHWPTLRPPSLPIIKQIRTSTPSPLPGSLLSFG